MDKWFKDILPDKDPYHNRGEGPNEKKRGSGIRVPVIQPWPMQQSKYQQKIQTVF
jgi:hypothetical protein